MTRNEIRIVSNATGNEIVLEADGKPKRGTLGVSYFGTISSVGIAWLQQHGIEVYNEPEWVALIERLFTEMVGEAPPTNAFGTRGPLWGTPEERDAYTVYMNGVEYNPPYATRNTTSASRATKRERAAEKFASIDLESLFKSKTAVEAHADEEEYDEE